MSSSLPATLTSTLQSLSINRAPSPTHDLNPSTSASANQPVELLSPTSTHSSFRLRPRPRRAALPPLPDLRFEQSYLASLRDVEGWRGVAWVTVRDQVIVPLLQGTLWTLLLMGWRHWNRSASFSGASVGSKIRRWWWGVNNWEVPAVTSSAEAKAMVVEEFYVGQMGAGGD